MMTMMLSGTLAKPPETRTSKNGNAFATTTVRTPTAEGDLFASVTAFGELVPILARLAKAGLSVIASRIIALVDQVAPPKSKATRPKEGNGPPRRLTDYQQPAGPREFAPDFDDDLPLL